MLVLVVEQQPEERGALGGAGGRLGLEAAAEDLKDLQRCVAEGHAAQMQRQHRDGLGLVGILRRGSGGGRGLGAAPAVGGLLPAEEEPLRHPSAALTHLPHGTKPMSKTFLVQICASRLDRVGLRQMRGRVYLGVSVDGGP